MRSDARPTSSDDDVALLLEQAASQAADAAGALDAAPRPRWLRAPDEPRSAAPSADVARVRRAHEAFCRAASARLRAEHRLEVDLELVDVTSCAFGDAHALGRPGALAQTLVVAPLGTEALLCAELALLRPAIARLLGGPPFDRDADRPLTAIDLALVRRVLGALVAELSGTWHALAGVTLAPGRLDAHAARAALVPAGEPTLAITLRARIATVATTLLVLVPHAAVAERLAPGEGEPRPDDAQGAPPAPPAPREVAVDVRAGLGAREVPLDEVRALRPGDVVRLGVRDASAISLRVDGEVVRAAQAGRFGARRAAVLRAPRQEGAA